MFSNTDAEDSKLILSIVKLGAAFGIFCMSFTVGILPIKIKSLKENVKWMGIANSFAAGVFLTIGFTELLPEAAETFENYAKENNTGNDYPISYYVAIGAFCFILFIEKIAFDSHALLHDHDAE